MQRLLRAGLDAGGARVLVVVGAHAQRRRGPHGAVALRDARRDRRAVLDVVGEFEGTSLEFIPHGRPVRAVGRRAHGRHVGRRAATAQLERARRQRQEPGRVPSRSSRRATYAREHGGKVVALTMPMSFPVYLSFRSGFVLDAMPGWEDVMLPPARREAGVLRRRRTRWRSSTSSPQQRQEPDAHARRTGATSSIYDVVAPENEQYRGRMVGEIAEGARAAARGDVLVDDRRGRRAQHQLRHRAAHPRPTTTGRRASRCGATTAR